MTAILLMGLATVACVAFATIAFSRSSRVADELAASQSRYRRH